MKTAWLYLLCLLLLIARTQQQDPAEAGAGVDDDAEDDDDGDGFIDGNLDDNDGNSTDKPTESMEEMIVNAANSTQEFDFMYDESNALVKVEYDMLYTVKEYGERMKDEKDARKKRTAGIKHGAQGGYRWTNGNVKYQIARGVFGSYAQGQIKAAMNDWARYTCLTFSRATSGNRMYFQNGGGCYSRVGMVGGAQTVGLAGGCRVKSVITHEVGHAIGLNHEQTRPDRDQYVRIVNSNIPSSVRYNFAKNSWNNILNMGIPYDYYSIMHYGARAFSYNGGITIQTVDSKYQNVIGNMHKLSFGDIKSINVMYNCKRAQSGCTLNDDDCPGEGFVGKDCQCWCPGDPYKLCGKTTGGGKTKVTPKPTTGTKTVTDKVTTKTGCSDQHTKCAYWARYKQCVQSPAYMNAYCKKSCGLCGGTTTTTTKKVTCADYHYSCPSWAYYGYCNSYSYASFMASNCKKSCRKCSSYSSSENTVCTDVNAYCGVYAMNGLCQSSPTYMGRNCMKTCGKCSGTSQDKVTQPATCQDKNTSCWQWAALGQCLGTSKYWMANNCARSCNTC